ncbi:MAG: putative lipopolysaccharide heptosyltransferase III [Verrucomicrobiota bacterium]|nr:putative lipopolysaccharide heptosyltransferase III [Verrucomicrobiota bacterium]
MEDSVQSIMVLKFRNIGDVLITTGALRSLRTRYPRAKITLCLSKGTETMVQGNPCVDQILVLDRKKWGRGFFNLLGHELEFLQQIRKQKPDIIIDYTTGDRSTVYSLLSGATQRLAYKPIKKDTWWKRKIYTHYPPTPEPPPHEVLKHIDLLLPLGIRPVNPKLELVVEQEDRDWAESVVSPFKQKHIVHVHPTSRWLYKCWDDQKMAETIDLIQEKLNCCVVLTSSPDEQEIKKAENIKRQCKTSPVDLSGKTSLPRLAALSSISSVFLGVDTAPMHMAAAVGVPVVALFGPSGVHSWSPWCDRKIVIRKPCHCFFPDTTQPQNAPHCEHARLRDCMAAIEVAEVVEAVKSFLSLGSGEEGKV